MEEIKGLPSLWQIGDEVSITFPGTGLLKKVKVIKVSFTTHYEPLYDLSVPFLFYSGETYCAPTIGHARIHGIKEWHLRIPEE